VTAMTQTMGWVVIVLQAITLLLVLLGRFGK